LVEGEKIPLTGLANFIPLNRHLGHPKPWLGEPGFGSPKCQFNGMKFVGPISRISIEKLDMRYFLFGAGIGTIYAKVPATKHPSHTHEPVAAEGSTTAPPLWGNDKARQTQFQFDEEELDLN
jgi:hypothetical protein